MTRRELLAGVAAGLAGLSAGTGYRKLVPFVIPPDDIVPGVSTWYASSCRECPAGCGLLLRNREARLVKAEGNPLHVINAGRLCARGQACLQGLYDPDRLRHPWRRAPGGEREGWKWEGALQELGSTLAQARRIGVLSDLQMGSLATLIREWLQALGGSSQDYWVYEPFNYESLREANAKVFGQAGLFPYRIDRCDCLISFGADFLDTWLSPVQFTRQFMQMRRVKQGKRFPFIYVGPRQSLTAAQADWRVWVRPGQESLVALALLYELVEGVPAQYAPEKVAERVDLPVDTLRRLAVYWRQARCPLALAGNPLPGGAEAVATATAAQLLNRLAASSAIDFSRFHALTWTATAAQMREFMERVGGGEFEVLVVLGANPIYTLSPDLGAAVALGRVKTVLCLNPFEDETVQTAATWALPIHTPVESWGDFEPLTGVYNLLQPAMGNYFDSRNAGDVLLQLAQAAGVSLQAAFGAENYYDYLRHRWRRLHQKSGDPDDFETFWHRCVQQGGWVLEVPAVSPPEGPPVEAVLRDLSAPLAFPSLQLYAYPSLHFFDGRHANKSWLQEVPDPMTRAVWGSAVELHPETAARFGIQTGDLVELVTASGRCQVPAHVWEGVAPGTLALATGQGHTAYGRYAQGYGVNAFALLSPEASWGEVHLRKLAGPADYVRSHGQQEQYGRRIAQSIALAELGTAPPEDLNLPLPEGYLPERDVYPGHEHPEHRWAMAVDLDRCIGCNACVVACYSENNIPVVGKKEVGRQHELAWLRIDRYDEGESPAKRVFFVPMMCQQCDAAPCEPVCPVYAAVHSPEGLNEQVYNRCVGTRYCANNCPYKVRRFNWFHFDWPEPLNYQLNPEVTVRDRGVMEKCSFCVQRIKEVTLRAKAEGRPVADGEITPACVQTCPAEAFVFGDLRDPHSRIARLVREDRRRYQVLRELNTKPAVFYQKKIV
jgi:molybdopterin-containing oxidoreductase family iron-sulfur binding subunit